MQTLHDRESEIIAKPSFQPEIEFVDAGADKPHALLIAQARAYSAEGLSGRIEQLETYLLRKYVPSMRRARFTQELEALRNERARRENRVA